MSNLAKYLNGHVVVVLIVAAIFLVLDLKKESRKHRSQSRDLHPIGAR